MNSLEEGMPTKAEGFFAQALLAMQKADNPWTDPIQFQEYRKGFQGADLKAPPLISVQNFAGLNKDLKSAGAMVLRLGGAGGLTEFRLIKAQISLKDEFLDEAAFSGRGDQRPSSLIVQ
jgi:hypothetical protein